MRDNNYNSRDVDFGYKTHVQYDRHYSKSNFGLKFLFVVGVILAVAYYMLYVA